MLGSSLRRSGHQPVAARHVKPGVADKNGPGTKIVPGTIVPAAGLGTVLGVVLTLGVIPA